MRSLALPLLLAACNGDFAGADKGPTLGTDTGDSGGDTADTGDSGDTGGESGDTADSAPVPATYNWVVATLEVGSPAAGFDFDADGFPDNGVSPLAGFLDPIFADMLATGDTLPAVQLSDVEGWTDEAIGVALLTVVDTDLDPSDNYTGGEDLFAGTAIDGEGVAVSTVGTEMKGGGYGAQLSVSELDIGDLTLPSRVALRISGYASDEGHSGLLGLGIPLSTLQELGKRYKAEPRTLEAIDDAPDLDLDGDGTKETVSASFAFTGVPCSLR